MSSVFREGELRTPTAKSILSDLYTGNFNIESAKQLAGLTRTCPEDVFMLGQVAQSICAENFQNFPDPNLYPADSVAEFIIKHFVNTEQMIIPKTSYELPTSVDV